ncbi:MAG: hypothetical protein M1561_01070 [Gammaproteobacteria bacterium]|nr:hypothetical protein [Gammaproteobacteria bacterium]
MNNLIKRNSRHYIPINCIQATGEIVTKKLTIKTRPAFWINTNQKVIFPFSINSSIYESNAGVLKISALLKLVKSQVLEKVMVLLCEKAHMHVLSIKSNIEEAFKEGYQKANNLIAIFKDALIGCNVIYWKDFIENDDDYTRFKKLIFDLYKSNAEFKLRVRDDANKTYNADRAKEFPNKSLYIKNAELDLLEQCIYLLITSKNGYRFEFYPGKRTSSAEFINSSFLDEPNRLVRVNVTLGTLKEPTNTP